MVFLEKWTYTLVTVADLTALSQNQQLDSLFFLNYISQNMNMQASFAAAVFWSRLSQRPLLFTSCAVSNFVCCQPQIYSVMCLNYAWKFPNKIYRLSYRGKYWGNKRSVVGKSRMDCGDTPTARTPASQLRWATLRRVFCIHCRSSLKIVYINLCWLTFSLCTCNGPWRIRINRPT